MLSNPSLLSKRQVLFRKLLLSIPWPVGFYLIRCSLGQVVFHVCVGRRNRDKESSFGQEDGTEEQTLHLSAGFRKVKIGS